MPGVSVARLARTARTARIAGSARVVLAVPPRRSAQRIRHNLAARLAGAVLLLLCASCQSAEEPPDRPNLVLIIADDLGYPYAGFMGDSVVQTPNLDRLAREGTLFRTGYVTSSRCRDSLLSIVTGLQPYQLKRHYAELASQRPRPTLPNLREIGSIPGLLQARQYRSFQAGKFWGGTYASAGFTDGTKSDETGGAPFMRSAGGAEGNAIGRTTMQPVYDFIDEHADEPFFLWFAPALPHNPMDAGAAYRDLYAGQGLSDSAIRYYANVSRFDAVTGELLKHLDECGLTERTIVVYLSDNGWQQGPHESYPTASGFTGHGPKGKGSLHELGFRTPIIFRWPGQVPAAAVHDHLVSTVDVFQTLLDYAGVEAPRNRRGTSLRQLIEHSAEFGPQILIGQMPDAALPGTSGGPASPASNEGAIEALQIAEGFFLRSDAWHFLWFPARERSELYSVVEDPDETRNVAASHPALVARFQQQILRWKAEMAEGVAQPSDG